MPSAERRRETRIPVTAATYRLNDAAFGGLQCAVHNLSRMGVGIVLPENHRAVPLDMASQVEGTLQIGTVTLTAQAVVRVRRGSFVGLEYTSPSREFVNALKGILSPKAVASAIESIPAERLPSHLEYAFRGPDFELLSFKPGKSAVKRMLQLFISGQMVEINNNEARVVPAPLIRTSGVEGGFEFFSEFDEMQESQPPLDLEDFFGRLRDIAEEWPECPQDIRDFLNNRKPKKQKK
jgi:hypothetical protein